jgi:hypothetical protein
MVERTVTEKYVRDLPEEPMCAGAGRQIPAHVMNINLIMSEIGRVLNEGSVCLGGAEEQ